MFCPLPCMRCPCCALWRLWTRSVEVQQSTLSCLTRELNVTQFRLGRDCVCVGHIDTKWEISYDNIHVLPQRPVYQYSSLCMHQMQWSPIALLSPGKTFHRRQLHQLDPGPKKWTTSTKNLMNVNSK